MTLLYTEIGPNGSEYKKGEWKSFAIHNDKEIKGFFGEYRFLSNFWSAKVFLDNIEYKNVELAYQASKWKADDRKYFLNCMGLESIDYNRNNIPNGYTKDEWDVKKVEIMKGLLVQKFDKNQNPELYEKLKSTGTKYLEEMNWWDDTFWGKNKDGVGENMLGKLIVEIRDNK